MLRITGGTIGDPANGINGEVRDLYIADGKFSSKFDAGRTIDATGMVIMPGGVDVHTHVAGGSINFARAMTLRIIDGLMHSFVPRHAVVV